MRKHFLVITILFISVTTYYLFEYSTIKQIKPPENSPKITKKKSVKKPYDKPDQAILFDLERTKDPKSGYVTAQRRFKAFLETKRNLRKYQSRTEAAVAGVTWEERGPNNVGGRTRALVFDPSDPDHKKVWAGSVSGGLWYNEDITMATSPWKNVDDFWANLAITSIAFDPSDDDVMYVATGEGWFNFDAVTGAGIWKSSDGGTTFTQLASTDNSTFTYVQKIVVASNGDVFAATRNASVQRSEDGGDTWSRVLSDGGTSRAADLEIATNGDIYASLGIFSSAHIFRSSNNGDSWTEVTPPTTSGGRIELAVAPSASSQTANTVVYAVKYNQNATTSDDISWIRRTSDGGSNWSDLTIPTDFSSGNHFTRGQGWYNLIMSVHPTDEDIVLMGGIDLYRTADGGTNWNPVSQWFGGNNKPYVHADNHAIVFRPGFDNEAIFGNDGGIYYSPDAGSATDPNFSVQNYLYNVTQFYSVAMENNAGENYFLAGTQDNGTHQFNFAGINPTVEVTSGDGGFTFIDQDNANVQITSFTNNNYFLSTNGGASFSTLKGSSNNGSFINPADYDNDENILYAAGNSGRLERYSGIGGTVSHTSLSIAINAEQITAVTVSDHTTDRIFVGTNNGSVYRIDNAAGTPTVTEISDIVDNSGGTLSSIAVGGTDNTLVATLSNFGITSVFYSSNGGTSWTSKDESSHGLPDMPVRWALFNPDDNNEVLLATEQGVWSTDNITASNPGWEATNSGLANVRCDMLQYREADKLVAIASHGRGLYTTDVFSTPVAQFTADKEEWYVGVPLQFEDASLQATSWEWDFDNDGNVDATTENPIYTYMTTGSKTVKLTINSDAGLSITKTNFIEILDRPEIPFSTGFESDGAGFCSYLINAATSERFEWGAGTSSKPNFNPLNAAATITGNNNWMTSLTGSHGFSTKYALETPPFSFLGADDGTYTLSFDYRAATGNGAGMNMEYSLDGGETWTVLGGLQGSDANAISNWYTDAGIIGLSGASGWTGASFQVFTASYDISEFRGETDVRLRFVFGARGSSLDGFQIDDFSISGTAVTAPLHWEGTVSNDWTAAANWENSILPGVDANVIIPESSETFPVLGSEITLNAMLIEDDASFSVGEDGAMSITDLYNEGTLTVESGGALALMGDRSGDGTETIERALTGNASLSIIGIPVAGATIADFDADYIFEYNNISQNFTTPSSGDVIAPGNGYFVGSNTVNFDLSVSGTINSADVTKALTQGTDNFSMVANPYAAPINASDFFSNATNTSTTTGTAYLWNDAGVNVGGLRGGDYISVNSVGVAGGPLDPGNGAAGSKSTADFDGSFNSMQGFFVEVASRGNVVFQSSMQVLDDNGSDSFFKQSADGRQLVKLAISGNGLYNDLIVALDEDATDEDDYSMDARKFSGNEHISFYSMNKQDKYAIQALPSNVEQHEVSLGYQIALAGDYQLSVEAFEMPDSGLKAFLFDSQAGDYHELDEEFVLPVSLNGGEINDRFKLVFGENVITDVQDQIHQNLKVYSSHNGLIIEFHGNSQAVSIFDLTGREVFQQTVKFDNSIAEIEPALDKEKVYILTVGDQKAKFILR
ncbi:MAG: PKD domain-containing protein [Bacteroidota bacterium]